MKRERERRPFFPFVRDNSGLFWGNVWAISLLPFMNVNLGSYGEHFQTITSFPLVAGHLGANLKNG